MRNVIVCECGTVVRGDDVRELLANARGHMQANHPAIAEQITDEQLLALGRRSMSTRTSLDVQVIGRMSASAPERSRA